jgi:5-methyltetrahydropteroyltriglutamate--homocysteine methyltransferase
VSGIVARQVEVGVDVVNDGEMGKVSYVTYVTERLSGFRGKGSFPTLREVQDFPEWAQATGFDQAGRLLNTAKCESFMTAASPGVISLFLQNGTTRATRRTSVHSPTR